MPLEGFSGLLKPPIGGWGGASSQFQRRRNRDKHSVTIMTTEIVTTESGKAVDANRYAATV